MVAAVTKSPIALPIIFWLWFTCLAIVCSGAFISSPAITCTWQESVESRHRQPHTFATKTRTSTTQQYLVPISTLQPNTLSFLADCDDSRSCITTEGIFVDDNGDTYELCLAEENDLPDVARFVVQVFGADAITMSSNMNSLEQLIMKPAVELVNGYSGIVAFAEVLAGLRSRLKDRMLTTMDLSPPRLSGQPSSVLSRDEKLKIAASTSLVLALAKRQPSSNWHIDVIASVELRLQPCDAKIPFSLPWIDRQERRLASLVGLGNKNTAQDLQPYLSNLCVDEKYRGKNIGRALTQCVEDIARTQWGYKRMYLHVDLDNESAFNLYKTQGYRDVGLRWNPFWAGKAADIGYFFKNLESRESSGIVSKLQEDPPFAASVNVRNAEGKT